MLSGLKSGKGEGRHLGGGETPQNYLTLQVKSEFWPRYAPVILGSLTRKVESYASPPPPRQFHLRCVISLSYNCFPERLMINRENLEKSKFENKKNPRINKKVNQRRTERVNYTVKQAFRYSRPGMSITKLSLGGNNFNMRSLFPPSEILVSCIPAGDGNIEKVFYSVDICFFSCKLCGYQPSHPSPCTAAALLPV